jgi:hypothetical protein
LVGTVMTALEWAEFAARRPFLTPSAHRSAMESAIRLRESPISATLAVLEGANAG